MKLFIIIFEGTNKKEIFSEMITNILKAKNYYYLIAEIFFYNRKKNKIDSKANQSITSDNLKEYYGLSDELENEEKINLILDSINNIVLYINPYVVISSFNKKLKIYKDYILYEDGKNTKQYSYEFNIIPSLENGQVFTFKDYNIINYFKINNGLNFVILEFELIYNYILLLNDDDNYMTLVNDNKEEFYEML